MPQPSEAEEKQQLTAAPAASKPHIDTSSPLLAADAAADAPSASLNPPGELPSPRSPLPQTTEQLLKPASASPLAASLSPSPSSSSAAAELALPAPTASSYESLRSDFNSVLSELWQDRSESSLERFRSEFDKLLSIIRRHGENERRLVGRVRELNTELVGNAAKIQTALRLSFQDQANIAALKAEVEKAWKVVDAGAEKEKKGKDVIAQLKAELTALRGSLQLSQGRSETEQQERETLQSEQQQLRQQLDAVTAQYGESVARAEELSACIASLDLDKQRREKEVLLLKEKYAMQKAETARHFRKCERLGSEVLSMKEAGEKRQQAWQEKETELSELRCRREEQGREIDAMQAGVLSLSQDNGELKAKYEEAEQLIFLFKEKEAELYAVRDQLQLEMRKQQRDIKLRDNELSAAMKRIAAVEKEKAQIAQQRAEAERYKSWIKDEMKAVLRAMDGFRREAEGDEAVIRELQAQIKKMQQTLAASVERSTQQHQLMQAADSVRRQLEADVAVSKGCEQELRLSVHKLEKERERESLKSSGWFARCKEKEELVKLRQMEVAELKKAVQEERQRLRLQQTLYEQVRNDRNLFSRQQIESEDEINEMRRKFRICEHQIEQLKEEIATKDAALINEHFTLKRVSEEQKMLKRRLNKRKEALGRAEEIMAGQSIEIRNLRKVLNVSQQAEAVHARQYDDVIAERDMIGSQLIRRNDELALLYEKLRIQQSVLRKGEEQYRERLRQLRERQQEVSEAQRRLAIKVEEGRGIEMMKTEIRSLQSELSTERSKVKALSEELENPLNVHRWRKLEGSDPQRFDLLQKIQTLQRRLIAQTERTVEAVQSGREKDRLYQQLKLMLARQPGPEVVEALSRYERGERDKARQMRAMCAEMNMLNAEVQRLSFDNGKLEEERAELKRRFLAEQRRREQQSLSIKGEEERKEQETIASKDPFTQQQERFFATQPRITGGGFNLQPGLAAATSLSVTATQPLQQH